MARTPKLSDIQLILLTTAAGQPDGSLLPPPDSVTQQVERIGKAVAALIKRGFAEEAEVAPATPAWREDGERHIGVLITTAGREAISLGEPAASEGPAKDEPQPETGRTPTTETASDADSQPATSSPRPNTKQALVVALLRRDEGATLAELVEATGWLPHTTRAALTGLRKKGHALTKSKRDDTTCYHVAAA